MANTQKNLWGDYVRAAVDNLSYVVLSDKKEHRIMFLEKQPQVSVGEFGNEMSILVSEDKQDKKLTITRPLARELAREFLEKKVDVLDLKQLEVTIVRRGKGYTTNYTVTYEQNLND